MSKQQTAVEWLASSLGKYSAHWDVENCYNKKGERIKYLVIKIEPEKIDRFILKAKQMECEQIAKAWERRAMDVTGYDYYRLYHGKLPIGGDHE